MNGLRIRAVRLAGATWAAAAPAALCAVLGALAASGSPARADNSVAANYKTPTITIPYAWHKPTMDGIVRDSEWNAAASVTALQTTDHSVSTRQTRFWMMWDENNLYVAMRSPLRHGERLIDALRETDHDVNVVFDDSYEIWVDAGTRSPDGEPAVFQYLGNFAGARYDVMQEPAVGNSRISWTAGWNPHNRITADGSAWECTLTIPRASIYKTTPFTDGFTLRCLMSRNYKRPWEQNTVSGSGSFAVGDTYSQLVLSKTAPAVHLLSVGDPASKQFGVSLAACGTSRSDLVWTFDSDGGVHKNGPLPISTPDAPLAVSPPDAVDVEGPGAYRITVREPDGGPVLLDWSANRKWGDGAALTTALNDTGDRVDVTLVYNPVRDYLRVTGDMIDYDNRASIGRYAVSVLDGSGKTIASKDLKLDSLSYVRGVIDLPNLPAGSYTARLELHDLSGKVIVTRDTPFSKKDRAASFAWWNTPVGDIDRVIAPWTPVVTSGARRDVWGRSMQVGAAGLPARVTTQGRDLLAGPVRLKAVLADGKVAYAQGSDTVSESTTDYRSVSRTTSLLGPCRVTASTTVEFDGMYKVTLVITPPAPVLVKSLQVIVPMRPEAVDYLHACGEGIRYGFDYRFLPRTGSGRLWASTAIDGQPMVVGSFIPYIWLGNPSGGLCWFADSDQGWTPTNSTPAIEVRRDSTASTDLVLNLIRTPTTIDAARTITFAFEATPVKPIQDGWRMDTWWTGDSFQDWAQVESEGHAGNMGLIFSSLPFPLDPAKSKQMVDERHQETNAGIFGFAKYRANAVPYFEHINMGDSFVPEFSYFEDEWRTHISRGLAYGKSLQDFMVYHVAGWARDCGIDGFYLDNVYPIADDNVEAGRGYRLPDGRIQPAYQMFDTRRYFLRMRAALAEQGKSGKLVFHITNHMIAPWIESADIALDGEDHVIYSQQNKDFMDFWSLQRLRMDYPEQWGVAVNFLQEYQGAWDHDRLMTAMRAYTGMQLLDDTLASANANSLNQPLWRARERFGIAGKDVVFLPYWDERSGLSTRTPGVYVVGWRHTQAPGGLLIAVVNTGEAATAVVALERGWLGLTPQGRLAPSDAEAQTPLEPVVGDSLSVTVPRHDYRLISIPAHLPAARAPSSLKGRSLYLTGSRHDGVARRGAVRLGPP